MSLARQCARSVAKLLLVAASLLVSLGCAAPAVVGAAAIDDFAVYPTTYDNQNPATRSWFIFHLANGQVQDGSVTIANLLSVPLNLKVYPVDAVTTREGTFASLGEDDPASGVGKWITLSLQHITLQPKERRTIPLHIVIPRDASVGDHLGSIIFQKVPPDVIARQGANINVVTRVGVRVYETVPGARDDALAVTSLQQTVVDDHDVFDITLQNKGNTLLTPEGTLTVHNSAGAEVAHITLNKLGSTAPTALVSAHVVTQDSRLMPGTYTADVDIGYGTGKHARRALRYGVYTWYHLAAGAVGAGAILVPGAAIFWRVARKPYRRA